MSSWLKEVFFTPFILAIAGSILSYLSSGRFYFRKLRWNFRLVQKFIPRWFIFMFVVLISLFLDHGKRPFGKKALNIFFLDIGKI